MDFDDLLLYGMAAIVVLLVSAFIIRAIFAIPTFLKQTKAQTALLALIAKGDVDKAKVDTILSYFEYNEKEKKYLKL